jgi:hypothetical protein
MTQPPDSTMPQPPDLPPVGGGTPAGGFTPPPVTPPPVTPPTPVTPPPVAPPIGPGGAPPAGGTSAVYQRMGGQSNLLGWLSLIFGIIATGCCCCWFLDGAPFIGGIPAIILGVLHLMRVRQGRASMKWTAWVGIILAVIAIIGAIVGFANHWQDDLYNEYKPS